MLPIAPKSTLFLIFEYESLQPLYIEHAYNVTNHWSKFMKFDFFLKQNNAYIDPHGE